MSMDEPMTPMYESALGLKELFDTYVLVGFDDYQALELVKAVASAVAKAMHDSEVAEEANRLRAGVLEAAQEIASRMGQRPRQWGVPPGWPGQTPGSSTTMTGAPVPPGGWMCPRCRTIVPMLPGDLDHPPRPFEQTPEHIISECAHDHHATRWAAFASPSPPVGLRPRDFEFQPEPETLAYLCPRCGLGVPFTMEEIKRPASPAFTLAEECDGTQQSHYHRFPMPAIRCFICGKPCVEDDGRMVCPDHPSSPPELGGMET